MSRWIRKSAGWLVGTFGVLAMTFGASVALATPVNAMTCLNDGVNSMGEQPSYFACVSACYAVHGEGLEEALWNPTTLCCRCLY